MSATASLHLTIYVVWEYHVRAMVYKKEKT